MPSSKYSSPSVIILSLAAKGVLLSLFDALFYHQIHNALQGINDGFDRLFIRTCGRTHVRMDLG
jgi:hypothetical protein